MRQIVTIKEQTISDLAVQEYGNADLAFQILHDNPHIAGLNDLPPGVSLPAGVDFNISYPVKAGVVIYIDDNADGQNTKVADQLNNIIS